MASHCGLCDQDCMMNPVFKEKIAPKWHYLDLRLRYLYVAFISQAWLFIGVISYVWNDIIIGAPKDIARYAILRLAFQLMSSHARFILECPVT
jgi:hypothetical protein